MIPPRQQWCIQIEVTNACRRACSNCTRALPHARQPFFIDIQSFEKCLKAVADFPRLGQPGPNMHNTGRKVIGLIGGEPLLHPEFPRLCELMRQYVPDIVNRGLWTGWADGLHRYRDLIAATFGPASNYNFHDPPSVHQPILVAIRELVPDEAKMWRWIEGCWVQRIWSSSATRKGFFYCEVAAALDEIFDGPGGLPLEPGCWQHDLEAYREQIERWCPRCGCAAPLPGRLDNEQLDDVSPGNLAELTRLGSPRVAAGAVRVFDCSGYDPQRYAPGWTPNIYRTEQRPP